MSLCDKCSAECRNKPMPGEVIIQCGAYKPPQTNADRIRAMSDEELAEVFCAVDFCGCCKYARDASGICHYIELHPDGKLFDGCVAAAKKWLQQPAEGDDK